MLKIWRTLIVVGAVLSAITVAAAESAGPIPEITNFDEIAKNLKLKDFKDKSFSRKIKIAVLDNGFNGYEKELGKSLPKETVYHDGKESVADKIETPSYHGLFMAQLIAKVIEKSGVKADYELHLFNAFGYTKLEDAIDNVIKDRFDIVLYSIVWEYGGNGDAKGFINALVDKAVQAGIVWVNAAGNFGKLTKSQAVNGTEFDVKIECKAPAKEQCPLRMILAWNDFKDDIKTGTDKDMDLFLYDKDKKLLASSERNQKLAADDDQKTSLLPRELIEMKLDPGTYTVKIKTKSTNFDAAKDVWRLTTSGTYISMDKPTTGETILPPADNPGVIVVGAADDENSAESKKSKRPDFSLISMTRLKDGSNPFSTSNAAAMAAGVACLHMGVSGLKTKDEVLVELKKLHKDPIKPPKQQPIAVAAQSAPPRTNSSRIAIPLDAQPGYGQGPGNGLPPVEPRDCLVPSDLPFQYPELANFMRMGPAIPVAVNGRPAIAIRFNLNDYYDLSYWEEDQIPFLTPRGVALIGRQRVMRGLPPEYYQIIPQTKPICRERYEK